MSELSDRISQLSPKRLALLALELEDRLQALERERREPIAIVGLGCRLPGAGDPQAFWQLLRGGVDAITEVPPDRWAVDELYDADPDAPGKMSSRWGGFLDDCRRFDPHFFGISPREAVTMDPQQRLLLEVCWEALENGGIAPDRLHGSQTGVFVGVCNSDYGQLLGTRDPRSIDAYLASGNAFSILSGRVSYLLGLNGPSISVDTACSSSLVAIHLACQSLRLGECRMALAGGVNVIITPRATIALSRAHMLATDGRCKTFDGSADGFVRGEGCGVVVLKRLSHARADGDRVLAIIRGTAANQDGRSSGLTAPNGPSQEAVIRAALAAGTVQPADVDYVETHGTGTALGDPIEARALASVLGSGRAADRPIKVGSVKTNIGHLESAAGVAGLIKIVLGLLHEELPPHLHFKQPNPHIPWSDLPLQVLTERTPWARVDGGRRRIAGVSSFGFSGTNAHVVVEEAPAAPIEPERAGRPLHLVTLSARSDSALRTLAQRYVPTLNAVDAPNIGDLCYTLSAGRKHHAQRLAFVADSPTTVAETLARVAAGDTAAAIRGEAPGDPPEVVFLFTGQGSQYVGMGRALYETQPTFKKAVDRCCALVDDRLPRPLLTVMFDPAHGDLLDRTGYTQPALFTIEYALAELWRSWGVTPTAAMGHSVGEFAAACVGGVLSLEDAIALVAARGRLMEALPAGGAMAAVFAARELVEPVVATQPDRLAIAAINGPEHTVVSGTAEAVQHLCDTFQAAGVRSQVLTVSHAFHSPLMAPMLDAFRREAARVSASAPQIGFVSNVTGALLGAGERLDAEYWVRHVMAPVQFAASISAVRGHGRVFLEIGPHPTLLGMARRFVDDPKAAWLPSLRKGRDDWRQMLETLGGLYIAGAPIDWSGVDRDYPRSRVALPTYPFERQVYWPQDLPDPASSAIDQEAWRKWLYEHAWEPDTDLVSDAAFLAGPAAISESLGREVDRLYVECGAEVYNELYPRLDEACTTFVIGALRALGANLTPGDQFTSESLADTLAVVAAHRRLFYRLIEILSEDGYVRRTANGWEVARELRSGDGPALMQASLERFPQCGAEISFMARSAPELADVLRGRSDPLQVLFPGGSIESAEALYETAPGLRLFNSLVAKGIASAIANRPGGRPLRVLEVGAGTGGTSAFVLPLLPRASTTYVYTDVSSLFTARAQEKFAQYDFIEYRTLDAERDTAEQGFESASFDIIIAANVLHATTDLRSTLERVRGLLVPEGLLFLLETTQVQRFGDLTVGYTEGWWRFSDAALRPSYALLPSSRWRSLLEEVGFESATAVPGRPDESRAILANQTVLIARAPARRRERSVVVICGDREGPAAALLERARDRGDVAYLASRGDGFAQTANESFTLDPTSVTQCQQLLGAVSARHDGQALTVVNLWPTTERISDETDVDAATAAVRRACESVLALTQACAAAAPPPRLVLATSGACHVPGYDTRIELSQSPLWGFARSVVLEHPELRCTIVDAMPEGQPSAALDDVLTRPDTGERQFAIRDGLRLRLRLARSETSRVDAAAATMRSEAVYLVTGGLAGLGSVVAARLADRGARTLVLVGRREPAADIADSLEALVQQGVDVRVVRADVSVAADVDRVFEAIRATGKPLAGVIHAAGTTDDAALLQQSWDRFEQVNAAKVRGSWLLHQATKDTSLDFFVLFSTGASFLGSPGQSNHAAANAFQDALAHYRRARRLAGLSINWGAWSSVGAATRGGVAERVSARGLRSIAPEQGLRTLEHLLGSGTAQVAVLPIEWPEFLAAYPGGRGAPMFARFEATATPQPSASVSTGVTPADVPRDDVAQLRRLSPQKARSRLLDWVNHDAARVLALDSSTSLDPTRPLNGFGLDSLMAVELRNLLAVRAGRPLPATLLFNYPTVGELVDFLASELLIESQATSAAVVTATESEPEPEVLEELESLSEDELAALLASKLSGD